MDWEKRSSVMRYDSSNRHAFIVSGISKGIIGMFLYYNSFRERDSTYNREEVAEEHDFPKNFEGSFKIMEAAAILKMVEEAFHYLCFIIDGIVRNDDTTMQAVLKHPSISTQCQVLKSSKGKVDEETPVPLFLAYPSHRMKVVANHIFSIVNYGKARRYECTKADTIRLNKYWGYMINKNRSKSLEELLLASKFPLEHMFNNNGKCSAEWCFKTRVLE